jgi:hypothetical protein
MLRRYKATTEYHKTIDIFHVMRLFGHKNIRNTLVYTQLIDFKEDDDACRVAKTVEEARELIEAGFEFVCDFEGSRCSENGNRPNSASV